MTEKQSPQEIRMRCIESATKLFGGRVGATIGDVLVAADKFETFVVVGNRQTLRPDQQVKP